MNHYINILHASRTIRLYITTFYDYSNIVATVCTSIHYYHVQLNGKQLWSITCIEILCQQPC
jgi:hypothetical protein